MSAPVHLASARGDPPPGLIPTSPSRHRPIRRLDRAALRSLVLGVGAVVVGLGAQGYLERGLHPVAAAAALAAAGVLFVRAADGAPASPLEPETGGPARAPSDWPRPALWLGGGALLSAALGLALFGLRSAAHTDERGADHALVANLAWAFYVGSVALALAAMARLERPPGVRGLIARNRAALTALGAILAVAAALRLYALGELPFGLWFDEAYNGLEIMKIMADPGRRPIFVADGAQGQPVLYWYLTIPWVWLLGPTPLALRVPTALAGVAGVAAVFLLGRALLGGIVGLTAAALVATMSWHVTFSRIAFSAAYSVALDAAALALLVLGLRTRRLLLLALAGGCLGLAQNFYYTSRLCAPIVVIYLVHRAVLGRRAFLRQHLLGLFVFAGFAALTAAPLALFAVQHPAEFGTRVGKVTIFREIAEQQSYQPLVDNARKHLLMFNVRGDSNGRHNLPNASMLARTTAALATLGFVLTLRRWRRPEYAVVLVWWLAMLVGGTFSLAYEAPQGLRTVDEVVAVALLAALPVAALAEHAARLAGSARVRLGRRTAPAGQLAAAGVVAVAATVAGAENVDRYFNQQASHFGAWANHSTAPTLIGRAIARGEAVGRVYVAQTYVAQPSIMLLAPRYRPHVPFDPVSSLPVRDAEGATIFLSPGPEDAYALATIRRMYPDADVEAVRQRPDGSPALVAARIPPEQVERARGVSARFWSGTGPAGEPLSRARIADFGRVGDPAAVPFPFYGEWRTALAVPTFGRYAFALDGPATLGLRLDEHEVARGGGGEIEVVLAQGTHALAVAGVVEGAQPVRLRWRPPGVPAPTSVPPELLFAEPIDGNGLLGSYYTGAGWSGEPALQRIDPGLQLRFHLLPLPRPYSVEWRGKLYVPSDGPYRLGTASGDESWLYLDERLLVENAGADGTYVDGGATLRAGFHDLRVRFADHGRGSFVGLFWSPPGRAREQVPAELLFPPRGAYPESVLAPPPATPLPTDQRTRAAPVPPTPTVGPERSAGPELAAATLPLAVRATVGQVGGGPGSLDRPRGMAADRAGNLYVVDQGNRRVRKFDRTGGSLGGWGGPDEFDDPFDVVVDGAGRVVVLDSEEGWLRRYTPDGQLVDRFGGPDTGLYHPRGLAIDAADHLYVADTGRGRVVKLAPDGRVVATLGSKGTGRGQLREPTGVAVDATGAVWVADPTNAKLVRFGASGDVEGELPLPKAETVDGPHVAVTPGGSVVVTDPEGGRLLLVGRDMVIRGIARVDEVARPVGVAVAPSGELLVGDVKRNRVFVLAPAASG